jgi:hypothetical protein
MVFFIMTIARLLATAMVLAFVPPVGGAVKDLGPKLPKQVLDWKSAGSDETYDRKTLYGYMDGGAEVYLAFDFREVFVRKYADAAGDELVLDIYDMGSSAEAFGMFSCDRQDPEAGIGQGSEYGPGLLRFWRGHFFVSVTVSGNEDKAEKAVLELGRAVAPLLGPDGAPPDLVGRLPAPGLHPEKTAYFHNNIHLSNRYFISPDNILNLDEKTACVFAEYGPPGGATARLLIVKYPGAARAAAAAASFRTSFLPGADAEGAARTGNKGWCAVKVQGDMLAAVFEAASKDEALKLAGEALRPPK